MVAGQRGIAEMCRRSLLVMSRKQGIRYDEDIFGRLLFVNTAELGASRASSCG